MKKLTLSLVIAILGIISLANAQSASLSVKGGLNMSNFYGNNLTDKNMQPGFHIGVGADLEFVPNISLQTGLLFTTKGAKYHFNVPIVGDVAYNINANYLQLPVHIAYKIDISSGTKVVFHAGPYVAYGIGGKRNIESKYSADLDSFFGKQEVSTFDKNFGFRRFDVGAGLGVGVELGLITVDLGLDMGLFNIARDIKINETKHTQNLKNQSAYLSLGYKF